MLRYLTSSAGAVSIACYTAFQLISNIISVKVVVLPLAGLSMDGGTLVYPFTFTLRDFIHKSLGKKASRIVIITAAALNLAMAAAFWLVGCLPADPTWQFDQAYKSIFMPFARIVIASIIAQVISELVDTEIFSRIYKKFSDISGSLASNFIALIIDSIIFSIIAFAGTISVDSLWELIIANISIKLAVSLVSSPAIRFIPRQVEMDEI